MNSEKQITEVQAELDLANLLLTKLCQTLAPEELPEEVALWWRKHNKRLKRDIQEQKQQALEQLRIATEKSGQAKLELKRAQEQFSRLQEQEYARNNPPGFELKATVAYLNGRSFATGAELRGEISKVVSANRKTLPYDCTSLDLIDMMKKKHWLVTNSKGITVQITR